MEDNITTWRIMCKLVHAPYTPDGRGYYIEEWKMKLEEFETRKKVRNCSILKFESEP